MQLHCGSYNPNWSDFCFGNRVSEVVFILPIILTSKPSTLLGRDFKTNVYRSGSKCDPCITWNKTWLYLQEKFINPTPDVWETGHIKLGTTWTTIYNWSILYLPFQCWLRKIQNAAQYTVVTAHRMDWDFNWKLTFISNNLRGYLGKSQSKKRYRSWILYRVNFI